jgi:hypothetical protein
VKPHKPKESKGQQAAGEVPRKDQRLEKRKALLGCVQRRPVWLPTLRGCLVGLLLLAVLGIVLIKSLPFFLTAHHPIEADILVVEGWIPDYALEAAIGEFKQGTYKRLYVTGGPLEKGLPLSQFKTYADLGASVLVGLGMEKEKLEAVAAPEVRADRTYNSARALREFLRPEKPARHRLNVLSEGPHSRRTRLLFQKAFGNDWEIGVISVPDKSFDIHHWYRSSNGVRSVLDETIAYLYAKLFFHPTKPDPIAKAP